MELAIKILEFNVNDGDLNIVLVICVQDQYRFCYEAVVQELKDYIGTRRRPESTIKL